MPPNHRVENDAGARLIPRRYRSQIDFPRWPAGNKFDSGTHRSPDEFGAFIKAEIVKWANLVKVAGIQPE